MKKTMRKPHVRFFLKSTLICLVLAFFAVSSYAQTATCITTKSSIIRWTTSSASTSTVNYGTTNAYGITKTDDEITTDHYVWIGGLSSNTTYHFQPDGFNGDSTFTTYASIAGMMPVVTISFDDGNTSDWTVAWPLMKARNMRGQCFVTTGSVTTDQLNNWTLLKNRGWDFGSHTVDHYIGGTEAETMHEMKDSRDWLVNNGFGTPQGTVLALRYPGEQGTVYSESIARQLGYLTTWGFVDGLTWPSEYLNLPVQPGLYYCLAMWQRSADEYLQRIDNAYNNHKYVNLQFHEIGTSTDGSVISEADFIRILDRCVQYGIKVLPLDEVINPGSYITTVTTTSHNAFLLMFKNNVIIDKIFF